MRLPCPAVALITTTLACLALGSLNQLQAASVLGAEIEAMIGGRTKIVWIRGKTGGFLPWNDAALYKVMVFDTKEGTERELVPEGEYAWPRLSPDGRKVLFSVAKPGTKHTENSEVFIVDWDGKGLKKFSPGFVWDTYQDPKTKVQWVVVSDLYGGNNAGAQPYRRHRLDNPSVVEEIISAAKGFGGESAISGDGKRLLCQNPAISEIDTATGNLVQAFGTGCNLDIAPDGSYRCWFFDGSHRSLHLHDASGKELANIPISQGGEGLNGKEVWNPQWTNLINVFTMCGPFEKLHLPGANVYIGRFDDGLTKVEKFIRVCNTPDADMNPHAWVAVKGAAGASGPWDGIEAKLLADEVKKLQKGKTIKPAIEEFKKIAADATKADRAAEAQALIDQLTAGGKAALESALADEATDVAAAAARYKELAALYAGLETGDAAVAKLASAGFKRELQAWDAYKKMLESEAKFKEVPKAQANAKDDAWMKANKAKLQGLVRMARDLQKTFADTAGAKAAQALLDKYQVGPDDLK
jgi:hypothetical protein